MMTLAFVPAGAGPWMCDMVTAVMLVNVRVQSISLPRSVNVATPVPVVVFCGTSLAGERFATYILGAGAVLLPQLSAATKIMTAPRMAAASPTSLLRM